MITILQAVLLGALQGITEFLPVSSSGHLVVIQQLFGWKGEDGIILAFDVALHIGTLFAVLVTFRKDIIDMLSGRAWRLLWLVMVATVPAVIIGFTVKDVIEGLFQSVKVVGFAWLFTGTFLWLTRFAKEREPVASESGLFSYLKAFLIGCAQAVAILPGVSRSGSTISAGLFLGLTREMAAKFSFLMAIPAIAGGGLLDAKDIMNFPREGIPQLVIGSLVSFLVAYLTIKWLLNIIAKGKFWWFAAYCWLAGAATLIYIYLQ